MSGEGTVTKAIAEQFLKTRTADLRSFISIEPGAADVLSRCRASRLQLGGLTTLDEASAAGLSKYAGDVLDLESVQSLTAASAASLSQFGGDIFLFGLTSISDSVAEQLRCKKGGDVCFINRVTDPFPACSDEALLQLYTCPALNLPPDTLDRVSLVLKRKASQTRLNTSQKQAVKACFGGAEASDMHRATELLSPFRESDEEVLSVLTHSTCKKLLTTFSPDVWKALAHICDVGTAAKGLFLRSVADVCDATSNKSARLTDLRDMLGAFCGLTAESHPLLVQAVKLFVYRSTKSRASGSLSLCHDGPSGSLPTSRECAAAVLSADMAEAFTPCSLSLRIDTMTDEAASVLGRSQKTNWLELNGIVELSQAAAESLAAFPGYLKITSDKLPADVLALITADREPANNGFYKLPTP
jgi:hypothetical protein